MTLLTLHTDVEQYPITFHQVAGHGFVTDIGLLRNATSAGKAGAVIVITLEDGRQIVGETTWALLRNAVGALAASPVASEEVIDP